MSNLVEIITEDIAEMTKRLDLSELSDKTILITGASGLIGVYFLACLKQISRTQEFKTIAVMQSDPPPFVKKLLDRPGAEILLGDLSSQSFCESLPGADYIVHAAGYGQPGRFMENPVKTLQINTSATFSLFNRLSPAGKFLFVSTSEVYSGLITPPHKESEIGTTNTTHPRSCYIEAKRCGEAICNAHRAKGFNAKSARLSLAYGPGTRKGDMRVLNSFIQKAINGHITLLDHGKANRTYCYVSDAVEIMWNILLFGKDPVYNVGGHSRTTIGELAIKIGAYTGVPVTFPSHAKDLAGAPDDVYLDMTKALKEFGKSEFVPFDEGLARTIEWQKALYAGSE